MVCPNNECGVELPDNYDSSFCDMCNTDLFRCANPECSAFGVLITFVNCCPQCGEAVEPNGPREGIAPNQQAQVAQISAQPTQQALVQQPSAGQVQAAPTEALPNSGAGSRLFFRHSDGWTMEIADGDILGRVYGNHVDRLGNIMVISGTHAKIIRKQDGWYLADQGSRNGTWVNGKKAEPNNDVRIKLNDVVTLANQKFTVTEI